jgi:hypothetical protein
LCQAYNPKQQILHKSLQSTLRSAYPTTNFLRANVDIDIIPPDYRPPTAGNQLVFEIVGFSVSIISLIEQETLFHDINDCLLTYGTPNHIPYDENELLRGEQEPIIPILVPVSSVLVELHYGSNSYHWYNQRRLRNQQLQSVLRITQADNLWSGTTRSTITINNTLDTKLKRFREITKNVYKYYISEDICIISPHYWSWESRPTATVILEVRLIDYTIILPPGQPRSPTIFFYRGPPNPVKVHVESDINGTGRWYNWVEFTRTQTPIVREQPRNWH